MVNKINLEKQTYEVPNSRKPGQTGIYRNGVRTELISTFHPKVKTSYDIFLHGLKLSKDRPCLGQRAVLADGSRGAYEWLTYRQVHHRILNFGSGLLNLLNHTLNDSRTSNVPIAVWAVNRPEWYVTDQACSAYSLYTVALYDTLGPDSVEYVMNHSEAEIVVCSGDHIAHLLKLKEKLPRLRAIISMDDLDNGPAKAGVVSNSAIVKAWAEEKGLVLTDVKTLEEAGKKNRRSINLPQPEDLACLMYTSGTTGAPKGAMLTHSNFVAAVSGTYYQLGGDSSDISISYLPLAHIFGRVADNVAIAHGGRLGYFSGDMLTLMEDVQALKPSVMPTVPRLLNRVYDKIAASTVNAPGLVGNLARRGVAAKLENLANQKGYTHPLWDRLLFNKVKQALGGNMRVMITGSAPIGKDVMQFLRVVLCCDIREGYGATETTAATTAHYEGEYQAGHLGAPFCSNEIKLVDVPDMDYLSTDPYPRGEICVRGPTVFKGYYKDEEKTREALDDEGWYHTGDIGLINERGAIVIIDRKKNLLKLAQGEYVAPEKIENVFVANSLVAQVFVHGDSLESSLVAVVVPDPEVLPGYLAAKAPKLAAEKLTFEQYCKHPELNKIVMSELTKAGRKAGLHGFEIPKAVYLEAEPFSMENGLLTPTFKLKRHDAKKYYATQITELYAQANSQPQKAKL
ncbi:acetyl-CoA synthetase-like protein [Hesseltinella vesiculosa]|uniref:Long-chain-fatty-acid--CoA ligase n=1 Tax=Hesseltinella vesiculosa TaxID=101127 RepID=A0A1X2GRZ4_9FUNG|nr:acetyl-CoA synthetase-like protein [Hesseltinella vesiculosa]